MFLQQFVAICLVLSVVSEQCIRCNVDSENILINSGNTTITISRNESVYFIYIENGNNESIYSTPIESILSLTYDKEFKVNSKKLTRIDQLFNQSGNEVKMSVMLQKFLKPINTSTPIVPIQICFDFAAERLVTKIVIGILAILLLISNGTTARSVIETIRSYLLQPEFTRRFSWARCLVPRSKKNNSKSFKETSI